MSKNNPANRGKHQAKTYNSKKVKPALYIGVHASHGKYMAVQYEDGSLAIDNAGRPLMWDAI